MRPTALLFFVLLLSAFSAVGQTKVFPVNAQVYDLQGKPVDLKALTQSGHPTLISFWATWCKPCKLELTNMADLYPEWKEKYGLEIVAISTDNARTLPKVKSIVSQKRWDYTVLTHSTRELQNLLNFQTIPEAFLLDGKGNIIYRHSGYISGDEDELDEKLEEFFGK